MEFGLVIRASNVDLEQAVYRTVIDRAMEADPVAAKAEWLAEFRDDISGFVDVELIEACVEGGGQVRQPVSPVRYHSFLDPSGGAHDRFTAAVAHLAGGGVVL